MRLPEVLDSRVEVEAQVGEAHAPERFDWIGELLIRHARQHHVGTVGERADGVQRLIRVYRGPRLELGVCRHRKGSAGQDQSHRPHGCTPGRPAADNRSSLESKEGWPCPSACDPVQDPPADRGKLSG
jgi:hypothetical protein